MTIDRAIKREQAKAEEYRAMSSEENAEIAEINIRCSKYHEQLAEWLEELKEMWKSQGQVRDFWYSEGYTKAIDDFTDALIPRLTDAIYQKDVEGMSNLINDVAEQLKGRKDSMGEPTNKFNAQCKEVSNKFNVDDNVSACFVVNYSNNADICRDCSRKAQCSFIADQLNGGSRNNE